MAKGYWIGRVDVKDIEGMKQYASGNPPIFKKFGGRYLVRLPHAVVDLVIVEGHDGPQP